MVLFDVLWIVLMLCFFKARLNAIKNYLNPL